MTRKPFRILTAAFAAVAVAALSFVAPAANAAPLTSTIDDTREGTLTITKYEGPRVTSADCPNDGTALDASCFEGKTALAGAEFTIWQVPGVDLTTNDGWAAARTYYNAGTMDTTGMTPVAVGTTDANGQLVFDELPVGLYYVVETAPPPAADGATYTGAVPFFITMPMTAADDASWSYDLNVYPKNYKQDAPHKAVLDGNGDPQLGIKVGDTVTFRISSELPAYGDVVSCPAAGSDVYGPADGVVNYCDLAYYYVEDYFVENLDNIDVAGVKLVAGDADPTLNGTPALPVTFVEGTDYIVQESANGQNVRVWFLSAGLTKLAQNGGAQVVVDYTAEVVSIPEDGLIENQAYVFTPPVGTPGSDVPWPPLYPPDGEEPPGPGDDTPPPPPGDEPPGDEEEPPGGTPTNETVQKFGKIRIVKVGQLSETEGDTEPIQATFEIYRAVPTGTQTQPQAYTCDAAALQGQTALDTFTTDATTGEGVSNVMLRLSNWYNDGVEQSDNPVGNNDGYLDGGQYATKYGIQSYCLVEVEAADGYQLLADPVKFDLTVAGATTLYEGQEIVNLPDNFDNDLPLTGGQGIALLSIGGLALIGGGLGYYTMTSRKRRQTA
ncbi:MAG: SpaH/EbpB family LPXTG-anchored major pilin [Propionibacteriaceae bacterium]|nr:SpaH/EbpB family LPXTG-anchored major pilin [Propionibacteriaceae bacterium]